MQCSQCPQRGSNVASLAPQLLHIPDQSASRHESPVWCWDDEGSWTSHRQKPTGGPCWLSLRHGDLHSPLECQIPPYLLGGRNWLSILHTFYLASFADGHSEYILQITWLYSIVQITAAYRHPQLSPLCRHQIGPECHHRWSRVHLAAEQPASGC